MIATEQLQQLLAFEGGEHGVLSVYLHLAPSLQVKRAYRVVFSDLAKQVREELDAAGREALDREVARVEQYLAELEPDSRSLVVFSCTPRDFWQVYKLPVPVADLVRFEPTPYVRPLLDALDEYERYAVALVDKERARVFTVYLGEIEEERDLFDWVPPKHKQGGWSQANYQRHHEAHVHWHLKHVAEALATLYRRRPFDRLVLAGPEEATSELRRLLPRVLQSRVVGVFPAELFASEAEILERTLAIERQVERANEERLVAELVDAAGAGVRAVCGAEATLDALWRGAVHKLVLAENTPLQGGQCTQCERLTASGEGACPTCGAPLRLIRDLAEQAVDRALAQDAGVEIVHGEAAERLRAACGGLGALLRFPIVEASAATPPGGRAES
jgi:peptide chain release factor subunit 1